MDTSNSNRGISPDVPFPTDSLALQERMRPLKTRVFEPERCRDTKSIHFLVHQSCLDTQPDRFLCPVGSASLWLALVGGGEGLAVHPKTETVVFGR